MWIPRPPGQRRTEKSWCLYPMHAKQTILQLLKDTPEYISGEDISSRLGITRAAVWKHIRALREEGYEVDSVPNKGYRLKSLPDLVTAEEILDGLATKRLGRSIYFFDEIDSTNEEAKRRGMQGAPDGSLFIAESQTMGKGRLGRAWTSPKGEGLWFSILSRSGLSPLQISNMTLITGLSVCRAIRCQTGCEAMIKWPNDIVIGSRKVCGILTELAAEVGRIDYIVTGIGINVNIPSFPKELSAKATSLQIETGNPLRRVHLLQAILLELEGALDTFEKAPGQFPEEYRKLCVSLHKRVRFFRSGEARDGEAVDISPEGELIVREDSGCLTPVYSGEVTVQGIYGASL